MRVSRRWEPFTASTPGTATARNGRRSCHSPRTDRLPPQNVEAEHWRPGRDPAGQRRPARRGPDPQGRETSGSRQPTRSSSGPSATSTTLGKPVDALLLDEELKPELGESSRGSAASTTIVASLSTAWPTPSNAKYHAEIVKPEGHQPARSSPAPRTRSSEEGYSNTVTVRRFAGRIGREANLRDRRRAGHRRHRRDPARSSSLR